MPPLNRKKVSKKIAQHLKARDNRKTHNRLAIYELRSILDEYIDPGNENDILLKESAERCIQIIFNQEQTINELELERIFRRADI
jgi:hypothetical protein